jgi:branched-chain amino acid transport system substrate-binding protein
VKSQKKPMARALCVAGVAMISSIALTMAGATAQSTNVDGVTAKAVKIGFIYDGTGAAASTFKNSADAFQARIDRANAEGGANGRKIETEIIDDATSGANLTGAQDLVQNRHVFMVVNNSGVAFLSYRYLRDAGVPMIGGGYDGPYYSQPGNENIISALGYLVLPPGVTYNTVAKVMKKLGATKVATLAVSTPGSSTSNVFATYGPKSVGIESVYTNTTLDLGTTDVGAPVLGVKNSGADAVWLPMTASTVIAIMQGLKQNGVETKASV